VRRGRRAGGRRAVVRGRGDDDVERRVLDGPDERVLDRGRVGVRVATIAE